MKKRVSLIAGLLVLLILIPIHATVLGDLASSMSARSWKKMANHGLSLHNNLLAYSNSGVWDPVHKKVLRVGSAGTCCSDGQYSLITYDDATNKWSIANAPIKASGHAYDGNAIDPATGKLYFAYYHSAVVRTLDGSSWGSITGLPISSPAAPGAAWFPETNGGNGALIFVGGSGNAAWYNGWRWTVIPKPSVGWGSYHVFAEYNPVHQVVWLGGGNNGTQINYKLDAGLKLTKLPDAPITLRNTNSLESADPISGKYIVTNMDNSTWREFDITTGTWKTLSMSGAPSITGKAFHCPISTYGVIMYFTQNEVHIYKHSAGSPGVTKGRLNTESFRVNTAPNPFTRSVKVRVNLGSKDRIDKAAIYDIHGRLVRDFGNTHAFTWRPKGIPGGVYVLKITGSGKSCSQKLLLQ